MVDVMAAGAVGTKILELCEKNKLTPMEAVGVLEIVKLSLFSSVENKLKTM